MLTLMRTRTLILLDIRLLTSKPSYISYVKVRLRLVSG
jgi:hypothetical protein